MKGRLARLTLIASLILLGLSPGHVAFAQTATDLQALITQLQGQVKALEVQVRALSAELTASREEVKTLAAEVQFTKSLRRGTSGEEVSKLQEFLKQFPDVYPEGLVTGFFGPRTEEAVKRLQEKHGIEAEGIVGPKTRAKLNDLLTEGAGESGLIPPGLLVAPGLRREGATGTPLVPPAAIPPPGATMTPPRTPPPPPAPPPAATTTATRLCGKTLSVPSEKYSTIQSALDEACRGDVIRLAAGTYVAAANLSARHSGLTLTGAGMDQTILYGTGTWVFRLDGAKDVTIKNLAIERGGGRNIDGGGFWIAGSQNITLEHCRVRGSSANQGGAIAVNGGSSVSISRCLIDRNAAHNSAGGIIVREKSQVGLANVTIAYNTALGCHGGGLFVDDTSRVTVKNAILWGNTASQPQGSGCVWAPSIYGQPLVTYSDVQFGYSGIGTIDANPVFFNASGDDFHIASPSSPVVNRGDPATVDPDGSRADMGVFPYGTVALAPAPTPAPVPTQVPIGLPPTATSTVPTPPPPASATSTAPAPAPLPPPPPPPTSALPSGVTWVRLIGGSGYEFGRAVSLDGSGNAYLVGYTQSSALDGQTQAGGQDAFLAKYDPSGTKLWTRLVGNAGSDDFEAIAADASGNVYAGGATYSGSIDSQPAGGLLVKFDSSGSKLWTRTIGVAGNRIVAVAADQSGNVYAAGTASGSIDGQGYAGGSTDIFLAKYSSGGTRLWTRLRGSAATDIPEAVAVDASGNAFVAGWAGGSVGLESFAGGSYDAFVAKYDSGSLNLWQRLVGSSRNEYAQGVGVDAGGNVFITGYAEAGFDGQTISGGVAGSNYDAFVTKFDTRGTKAWTRFFGGTASEYVMHGAADGGGNVYIGGYVDGGLDGLANAGAHDAFIIKVDPNGAKLWSRLLGSGGSDEGFGVAVDSSGNPYLAGRTDGSLGQANSGGMDGFLAKFSGSAAVSPAPAPAPAPTPPPAPPPAPPPSSTTATTTTTSVTPPPPSSADTTPPVISNIAVAFSTIISGQTVAKITWTTNESADTELAYGLNSLTGPGGNTRLYALVTTHSVQTAGSVENGSTYVYQVKSTDAAGNTAASAQQSFTVPAVVAAGPFMLSPLGGEALTLSSASALKWRSPAVGYQASLFLVDAATQSKTWRLYDTSAGYVGENTIPWVVGGYDHAWGYVVAGQYYARVCQRLDGPQYVNCDLSDGSFSIVNAPTPPPPAASDTLGPWITNLSITPTSGPPGTVVTFTVSASDPSGIGNVIYDIQYPGTTYYLRPNCNFNGATSGTCAFSSSVDFAMSPTKLGAYVIETVRAADLLGNVSTYYPNGSVINASQSTHQLAIPSITIQSPPAATPPDLLVYRTTVGRVANPSLSGQSLSFSYELRGATPFISNSYILGEVLNFYYEVQNSGGAAVSGVVPGIAVGQASGGDDIRSGATTNPAIQNFSNNCPTNLAAGASCAISFNLAYTTGGTKYVYARLDPSNQIAEGVETNNDAIVSFILSLSTTATTTSAAQHPTIAAVLDALRTLLGDLGRLLERQR